MEAQWFVLPDIFLPSVTPCELKSCAHEKVSSNNMNNAHCLVENLKSDSHDAQWLQDNYLHEHEWKEETPNTIFTNINQQWVPWQAGLVCSERSHFWSFSGFCIKSKIILMKKILNYRVAVKRRGPDRRDGGFLPEQAALFHDNALKPH